MRTAIIAMTLALAGCGMLADSTVQGGRTDVLREVKTDPPKRTIRISPGPALVASPAANASPAASASPATTQPMKIEMPDGTKVEAPWGGFFDYEDSGPGLTRTDKQASVGGSATGKGMEVAGKTGVQPGEIHLEALDSTGIGGGGSWGSTGGIQSAFKGVGLPPDAGKYGGYGLGFLLIIGGVVLLVLPFVYPAAAVIPFRKAIGWGCVIAGATLIVLVYVAASPILMACLVAAFILGGGGLAAWSMMRGVTVSDARDTANWAIVSAVNDLEGWGVQLAVNTDGTPLTWSQVAEKIKERVDYHTDSGDDKKVRSVVNAIKKEL